MESKIIIDGPTKAEKRMMSDPQLNGHRIILRKIRLSDVNENYINWMNDFEVVKYTESRFEKSTANNLKSYIKRMRRGNAFVFFAIVLKENGDHIGNLKIGPIIWIHRLAEIGLIIGRRDLWNKSYATEAIKLAVDYSFKQLHLHKLFASIYIDNRGSLKAFTKANFIEDGIKKNHYFFNNRYIDVISLGILNEK